MEPIVRALEVLCAFVALSFFAKAEDLRRQAGELGRRLSELKG